MKNKKIALFAILAIVAVSIPVAYAVAQESIDDYCDPAPTSTIKAKYWICNDLHPRLTALESVTVVNGTDGINGINGTDGIAGVIYSTETINTPDWGTGGSGQLTCNSWGGHPERANDIILNYGYKAESDDFVMEYVYIDPLDRLNFKYKFNDNVQHNFSWNLICLEVLP